MKKVFKVLLLAVIIGLFASYSYAATDKYNDGSWKIDSTGAMIPLSGASQQVLYEKVIAADTFVTADSGKVIVYDGVNPWTGATFNLPTATVGLEYTFVQGNIAPITINPADADTIMYLTLDAGDKVVSTSATGDSVTLTCYKAFYWAVRSMFGTWTDGGA